MKVDSSSTQYCLCGLTHVRTGSIVIGLLEFVLVAHAIIFISVNVTAGKAQYVNQNPDVSQIILHEYMIPTFVVTGLWMLTILLMLVGVKTTRPLLTLPHLILQISSVVFGSTMAALFLVNAKRIETQMTVPSYLTIAIVLLVSLFEVYFSSVSYRLFTYLARRKVVKNEQRKLRVYDVMQQAYAVKIARQSVASQETMSTDRNSQVTPESVVSPAEAEPPKMVPRVPSVTAIPNLESIPEGYSESGYITPPDGDISDGAKGDGQSHPSLQETPKTHHKAPRKLTMQSIDFDELTDFCPVEFAHNRSVFDVNDSQQLCNRARRQTLPGSAPAADTGGRWYDDVYHRHTYHDSVSGNNSLPIRLSERQAMGLEGRYRHRRTPLHKVFDASASIIRRKSGDLLKRVTKMKLSRRQSSDELRCPQSASAVGAAKFTKGHRRGQSASAIVMSHQHSRPSTSRPVEQQGDISNMRF